MADEITFSFKYEERKQKVIAEMPACETKTFAAVTADRRARIESICRGSENTMLTPCDHVVPSSVMTSTYQTLKFRRGNVWRGQFG